MPRSLFLLGEVLFVVDDKRDKSRDDDRDNDDPEIEQRGSSAAAAVAGALVSARRIRIGRNGGIGCTGSFNGIGGDLGFGRFKIKREAFAEIGSRFKGVEVAQTVVCADELFGKSEKIQQ